MKRLTKLAIAFAVLTLIFFASACELGILGTIEEDVFRATSEKFAVLELKKSLTKITDTVTFNGTLIGGTTDFTLTIYNIGDYTMTLENLSISGGNASDFSIIQMPPVALLAQDAFTSFQIRFEPLGTPGIKNATLTIGFAGGATDSETFTLTGEASDGLLAEVEVTYDGDPVTYTDPANLMEVVAQTSVLVGDSVGFDFEVSNLQMTPLNITGAVAEVAGTDTEGNFAVTEGLAGTILQGAPDTFTVTFSPITTGKKNVEITIPNDDANEADFTFLFTAYAVEPDVAVYRTSTSYPIAHLGSYNYGIVQSGTSSPTVTFIIKNNAPANSNILDNSAADLTISGVTGLASPFIQTGPGGLLLAAQAQTTFTARFAPTSDGVYSDNVLIASDDPDTSTYNVRLDGVGGTPAIQVEYTFADPKTGAPIVGTVPNGGTIYLGWPGTDSKFDPLIRFDISNPDDGTTSDLVLSVPEWRTGLFGLPVDTELRRGAFRVEGSDFRAYNPGESDKLGPDDAARTDIALTTEALELARDFFFMERVELHTNIDDSTDTIFSLNIAAGNPTVLALGHVDDGKGNVLPAVWEYDITTGDFTERSRDPAVFTDRPGSVYSAFLTRERRLYLYGTYIEDTYYEAALFDFDLDSFSFVGPHLLAPARGATHSIAHDVRYSNGKLYVSGSYGVEPADSWWALTANEGFLGGDIDAGVYDIIEKGAGYAVTSTLNQLDRIAAWTYGTGYNDDGDAFRWAGIDPGSAEEVQASDPGLGVVLAASGVTSYTAFAGHQADAATYWLYDDYRRSLDEYIFGGSSTYAFGLAAAGIDWTDSKNPELIGYVAGVEDTGAVFEPAIWSHADGFASPTYIGAADGSEAGAYTLLGHVQYDHEQDGDGDYTELIVGGDFRLVPTLYFAALTRPDRMLHGSSDGRINRVINMAPQDFYTPQ